jgi:DNA polymerase-1
MTISDWRALPFGEIWCADFEYYPGTGLANGGTEGDAPTVLCLVARELRSGKLISKWQDELGPAPPYSIGPDALFIGYMNTAEFGSHIALGWGMPACSLDAYIEFRHQTNDGAAEAREKGFYSLGGALRYFGNDGIDTAHKDEMRDRIIQGPPFNADERQAILNYCQEDVDALAWLAPRIVPTIHSLPHAMKRAEFMWATAQQERRGVPLDLPMLNKLRTHWDRIKVGLVEEKDKPFGIYEIVNGVPHWRRHLFADLVKRLGMAWPAYPDGALDERDETFKYMAGRYPVVEDIREMRYSISKMRLNNLPVGRDGRNRTLLGPYGTKTARNAPSNAKYVFGPAKWIRFLIRPPAGRVLIHRDYQQQEVRVAAVVSGDNDLLAACESGDVYLGIAAQLGYLHEAMSKDEVEAVRAMFKTVVLGILYGVGYRAIAMCTGCSLSEAAEILARLRARFHKFEDYTQSVLDHAGLKLEISTPFGWAMQCPSNINPRTVRNFPVQSTASEILHIACILAERRGIEVVAPVHDAFMIEAPLEHEIEASAALDRVMRDASALVLRGYELPSDVQPIRPDGRYFDKRGREMWETVTRLVSKFEGGDYESS